MQKNLVEYISFEQAIDEVGALYEETKDALNNAYYSSTNKMVREGIDVAIKNNVKMRDYACVALQKAYGITTEQTEVDDQFNHASYKP